MIVYKCVWRKGYRYFSAYMEGSRCQIEYIPNKIVYPEIGKIFAFKDLQSSMDCFLGNEIWEAETTKCKIMKRLTIDCYPDIADKYVLYWSGKIKGWHIPMKGTVLCDDLKLMEKVQ